MKTIAALLIGLTCLAASGARASEPIVIGVDLPLTGPASVIGHYLLWGVEIAFAEANAAGGVDGRPLKAMVLDDETKPEKAAENARRLIGEEKAVAVLGPANSGNALAMIPVMQEAGKPLMLLTASATKLTRIHENEPRNYIFRATLPDRDQISFLVDWMAPRFKAVAIACDTTPYGQLCREDMVELMAARGMKPAAIVTFPLGALDMAGEARALAAANPDAVAILSLGNEVANFVRSADAIGFRPQFIGQYPFFLQPVKELPERLSNGLAGVLGSSPDASAKASEIDGIVRARYLPEGYYPFKFVEAAYEGSMLVIQALRQARSLDGGAVRDALENMASFTGVANTFERPFAGKRHELYKAQNLYMGVWKDGRVVRLDQ
ncbi:MAG: ABC transporter substrate-binding protein [Thermodesulfobacteriota bacterium]|jgi:branched-chain amino acid transport system substrate-binding protein